jgi:TPP-dependent pyruvate/acetoin dehydrogenase alpha subunit
LIPEDDRSLFTRLCLIRRFEETVLEQFSYGAFRGTTHTGLGQEANAVGVAAALSEGDAICSNHRCHGHFLAYGGDPRSLFAEMMGRATGVCGGRGGSQHLHWRDFYSNGILGGMVPVATGLALASKLRGTSVVTTVFLGDGALGEGIVYEALNMASLWQLPVLFVVENNGVAQSTPTALELAGSIPDRFTAFGIESSHIDTSDVREVLASAHPLVTAVRSGAGPRALVIETCRFGPHSKGDDTRPPEEVARMRAERDPVALQAARIAPEERDAVISEVEVTVREAFEAARADPPATLDGLEARNVSLVR